MCTVKKLLLIPLKQTRKHNWLPWGSNNNDKPLQDGVGEYKSAVSLSVGALVISAAVPDFPEGSDTGPKHKCDSLDYVWYVS